MKEREFQADQSIVEESSVQKCKRHEMPHVAYCFQCQHLICDHCVNKDCRDHYQRFEYLTVAVPEEKRKLREQLEPLKRGIMKGFQALEELQATRFEIEDQGYSVANRIESSFEELFKVMLKHKQELIREATSQVRYKLERILDQEKRLSSTLASMQRAVDYAERCADHLAGKAFMDMRIKIQDRMNSMNGNLEVGRNVEPVEEVDIGVELIRAKDLKQFCQTNSKIVPLATKYVVTGEGVRSAKVNVNTEFGVIATLSNGKPVKKTCTLQSYLKSLATELQSKCHVSPKKSCEYRIQYMPTVRGRHEVIVTVNGQEVTGSPFPVFVSIHPTQLGKPVQVITGVERPRHLALNPAGNIIVRDLQTITMVDKTGKKLMKSDYCFDSPHGVTVDNTDGCVYVIDVLNYKSFTDNLNNNSKIIKLSPDLKLKQVFESNSHFRGVSVVGDEVMVCCLDASVMVYTKELEYVRKIGSHGDGPGKYNRNFGLCSDEHSNVYVCDFNRLRVQVFSNGGEFLHSLDHGDKKLIGPHDVCVSGQYVYVTNYHGHSVSVFTTDGDYVTTFGQHGSCHGDLMHPCGVCVDKDGFVYVCDNRNDRLQIF